MIIVSSATKFVDASSNAIVAVKLAPLRKIERASATAAYEHEDDAAPRQAAIISVRDESSGRSRLISDFETTAWTIADNPKPRTSAHRISQDIANAKLIAAPIAVAIPVMVTSFASERDRESGGRRRPHHQPGVIRPAAHRG